MLRSSVSEDTSVFSAQKHQSLMMMLVVIILNMIIRVKMRAYRKPDRRWCEGRSRSSFAVIWSRLLPPSCGSQTGRVWGCSGRTCGPAGWLGCVWTSPKADASSDYPARKTSSSYKQKKTTQNHHQKLNSFIIQIHACLLESAL